MKYRKKTAPGRGATLGALNVLVLVGLCIGLIVSSLVFSNQVNSLQQQINNITLVENTTRIEVLEQQVNDMSISVVILPCYSGDNQPSIPSQMACLGNGVDSPTPNCNMSYTLTSGNKMVGPSICGQLVLTRVNGKTSVLMGFGGELFFDNATNNDNGSYDPTGPIFDNTSPFTYVMMAYRFDNYIPAAYRPSFLFQSIGVVELSPPATMLSTILGFFVWPNGTLDVFVTFGDTTPVSAGTNAWTITSQIGFWII